MKLQSLIAKKFQLFLLHLPKATHSMAATSPFPHSPPPTHYGSLETITDHPQTNLRNTTTFYPISLFTTQPPPTADRQETTKTLSPPFPTKHHDHQKVYLIYRKNKKKKILTGILLNLQNDLDPLNLLFYTKDRKIL